MFWDDDDGGEVTECLELDTEGIYEVWEVGVLRWPMTDRGDYFAVEGFLDGGI